MNLIRENDASTLTKRLGDTIVDRLQKAILASGEARMAVSGGSTPVALFEYLSARELDWSRVKVTLVDDRCVPEMHQDSNARLVRKHLLKDKAAKAQFVSLFCEGAASMDHAVSAGLKLLQHFPRYDAVVLGMGGDAHTASIFPKAAEKDLALAAASPRMSLVTDPVTAPHMRITQTLPQLLRTDFLALQITGEEKWKVLQPILEAPRDEYPISHFIHQDKVPISIYCSP